MRGKNLVVGGKVSIALQRGWTEAVNDGLEAEADKMSAAAFLGENVTWSNVFNSATATAHAYVTVQVGSRYDQKARMIQLDTIIQCTI